MTTRCLQDVLGTQICIICTGMCTLRPSQNDTATPAKRYPNGVPVFTIIAWVVNMHACSVMRVDLRKGRACMEEAT